MMNPVEQKEILDTFEILVDSREQNTDRAQRRYSTFGAPFRRATLDYGDYAYSATVHGKQLHPDGETVHGRCVIERKMNLDELAACFTHERDRFEREFKRAAAAGARIFLIIENASWENLLNGKYRSKFNANAFLGSITAWTIRYNLNLIFCKEESSGRIIKELLFRDLKERLERGEFDGVD